MQILEYTSIISTIRRSQRVWGRIMTFSGVIFALRKSAYFDVGGFDPNAPTEDIDLTWKLQRRFWDVFYENRAIAWIITPTTYKGFLKQRMRWARGLMYVIQKNVGVMFHLKTRRMWPVFIENVLSVAWVLCAFILFAIWVVSSVINYPSGISLLPLAWGISIASTNIVAQIIAINLDKKYDPQVVRYFFYTVYFPIYYWIFLAFISFIEIPHLFKKPKPILGWTSKR
jgi:biofilm PGA synthesis N-glycosyltransferase PgaC